MRGQSIRSHMWTILPQAASVQTFFRRWVCWSLLSTAKTTKEKPCVPSYVGGGSSMVVGCTPIKVYVRTKQSKTWMQWVPETAAPHLKPAFQARGGLGQGWKGSDDDGKMTWCIWHRAWWQSPSCFWPSHKTQHSSQSWQRVTWWRTWLRRFILN